METMAFTQQKRLFERLDSVASYATLSDEERMAYDADLKAYRDMRGHPDIASPTPPAVWKPPLHAAVSANYALCIMNYALW